MKLSGMNRIATLLTAVCACLVLVAVVLVSTQQVQPANSANNSSAPDNQQAAAATSEDQQTVSKAPAFTVADAEYKQGVVLAKVNQDDLDSVNQQLANLDFIVPQQITQEDLLFGYAELQLAEGVDVPSAVQRLSTVSQVENAQPNYVYHADSLLDEQGTANSATESTAQSDSLQSGSVASEFFAQATINDSHRSQLWGLTAIKAYQAWDLVKTERQVSVAVIDSGVDTDHPDLVNNLAYSAGYSREGLTGEDGNGHGTHVAGIVAAQVNNGKGVAGASYNARIVNLQALDASGNGDSTSVGWAINQAANLKSTYNIKVINMSLGGRANSDSDYDDVLSSALSNAHRVNLLVVMSAGNSGTSAKFVPVDFDTQAIGVINVKQSGDSYTRDGTSNYNNASLKTKELSAPGSGIYSTYLSGSYKSSSGTSMAAPYVSGTAALVFAAKPGMGPTQVKKILCDTATDLGSSGWDIYHGYGLVNAYAAVAKALGVEITPEPAQSTTTTKPATSSTSVARKSMYRMYNPQSGEHFYTSNASERNHLQSVGWRYEGIGWTAPSTGTAVYRMYNPNAGDHHYTTSASERDYLKRSGWHYEGVGWYSYKGSGAKTLYRLYNPNAATGAHHYTLYASERDHLVSLGWHYEGVGWYGM